MSLDLISASLIGSLGLHLAVAVIAALYLRARGPVAGMLATFGAVVGVWTLVALAFDLGWLPALRTDLASRLPLYEAYFIAAVFLLLSRTFLRLPILNWRWWAAIAATWLIILLFDIDSARYRANLAPDTPLDLIITGALSLGWGGLVGRVAWLARGAYRITRQALHKNRLIYWVPTLALLCGGEALLFVGQVAVGHAVRTLATLTAAYVILVHQLPDVREMVRRAFSFAVASAVTLALFSVGYLLAQRYIRADVVIVVVTGQAVGLAMLFTPLSRLIRRLVNLVITQTGYDPTRTVREYSLKISSIVDLNHLAEMAIALIGEALGAKHGALFLVDRETGAAGRDYILRRVGSGTETLEPQRLASNNPAASHLAEAARPLTQYDIDLLPEFRAMETSERAWLASLGADVYVPIYSKGTWIGLLALGPKETKDRYFNEDLTLLSTLADQTTVALENARLVDHLMQLNQHLRQAYSALDSANQELERLDRAKTDFIAVLGHELRTPLAVMVGYSQMMADEPEVQTNDYFKQMIDGVSVGAVRLQEITEAMLDITMIDHRSLGLHRSPTPLNFVVQLATKNLDRPLAERRLMLTLDPGLRDLPDVEVDPEAMTKVFYHLIVNAVKYTPDGGKIHVTGRAIRAGQSRLQTDGVEIVVVDTGIGINPENHELVFTKFYQTGKVATHSTGKTKFKGGGPGLGLAIVKGLVEAHHGLVWCESPRHDEEACPGSQFYVNLPLRQPRTEALKTPADLAALTSAPR